MGSVEVSQLKLLGVVLVIVIASTLTDYDLSPLSEALAAHRAGGKPTAMGCLDTDTGAIVRFGMTNAAGGLIKIDLQQELARENGSSLAFRVGSAILILS